MARHVWRTVSTFESADGALMALQQQYYVHDTVVQPEDEHRVISVEELLGLTES